MWTNCQYEREPIGVFISCPGQTNSEAFVAAVVLTYYAGNLPVFEEADWIWLPPCVQ